MSAGRRIGGGTITLHALARVITAQRSSPRVRYIRIKRVAIIWDAPGGTDPAPEASS